MIIFFYTVDKFNGWFNKGDDKILLDHLNKIALDNKKGDSDMHTFTILADSKKVTINGHDMSSFIDSISDSLNNVSDNSEVNNDIDNILSNSEKGVKEQEKLLNLQDIYNALPDLDPDHDYTEIYGEGDAFILDKQNN